MWSEWRCVRKTFVTSAGLIAILAIPVVRLRPASKRSRSEPASMSVLTKLLAPTGREGSAFGAASAAQGLGWGLGPLVGSVFVAVGGIPALYLMCSFVMGALVVPALRARARDGQKV